MNGIQENQKSESAQNAIVHIGIKPKLRKRKGKFYTYVYLDPRKPGKFVFGKYEFEYEPFYVGKGSGRRCKVFCQHIKHNPFLKRKLNKILPIMIFTKTNISEAQSFEEEKLLIKTIGRFNLKIGPLCNITEGGEGAIGAVRSKEFKQNLSNLYKGKPRYILRGRKRSLEAILKQKESNKGFKHSEETKKKLSKLRKGKPIGPKSEETKRKHSLASRGNKSRTGMKNSKEKIEMLRKLHTGRKRTEETKQKMREAQRKRRENEKINLRPH